jgi:hypothetical protein
MRSRFVDDGNGGARAPHLEFLRSLFGESAHRSILSPGIRAALDRADTGGWVLFLIDGYGVMNHEAVGGCGYDDWEKEELTALWPTTTACFMTSFHTGHDAGMHGVTGWWSYSERDARVVAPLSGRYLESGRPAAPGGYQVDEAVAVPFADRRGPDYDYRWFVPHSFWRSPYMNAAHRSAMGLSRQPYVGFRDLAEAFAWRSHRMLKPPRWVVYFPDYDHEAHVHGVRSSQAALTALRIECLIESLRAEIPAGVVPFLSADHGLIDVAKEDQFELADGHPLLDCLSAPPYGEPRQGLFRVKAGRDHEFSRMWNEAPWADAFDLVQYEDLSAHDLLSSAEARPSRAVAHWDARIALPKRNAVLRFMPHENKQPRFVGYHGGPTPEESRIPVWYA